MSLSVDLLKLITKNDVPLQDLFVHVMIRHLVLTAVQGS